MSIVPVLKNRLRIHRARKALAADVGYDRVAAWAVFDVPEGYVQPQLWVEDVRGLIACLHLQNSAINGGRPQVVTYWREASFLRTQQEKFRQIAKVGSLIASTDIVDGSFQKESWWPSSLGGRIEKALVVMGAVTTAVGFWALVIAPPEVVMSVPREPVRVGVGQSYEIPVTFGNYSRLGSAHIAVSAKAAPGLLLEPASAQSTLSLEAGKQEAVTLRGVSQQTGTFEITVQSEAAGGLAWTGRPKQTGSVTLDVWGPQLSKAAFRVDSTRCGNGTCVATAELRVGRPTGPLECWALLPDAGDVDLASVITAPDGGHVAPPSTEAGSAVLKKIDWRVESVAALMPYRAQLLLMGTSRSPQEWATLAGRLKWDCGPAGL